MTLKLKIQIIFCILVLLVLNEVAPKPFKKYEQVECVNVDG